MKPARKAKRYLTNRRGERVGVVLSIEEYRKVMADLEELESIRAYDAAKASGEEPVSFIEATREIERSRR